MQSFRSTLQAALFTLPMLALAQTAPATPPAAPATPAPQIVRTVAIPGGPYRFTVETTEAPDLTDWADKELIPVLQKWYPQIVQMLPSPGYTAPQTFSVIFTDRYKGVAATMGTRIEGSPAWYRTQLQGEAVGSMVHELVHVVQQYGGARKPGTTRPPGWMVEGLSDYIRWYLYEPQSKGCEISAGRAPTAKYDASYRVSANFLNFVVNKYDRDFTREVNAAMREGHYDAELWKTRTGHTVEELAEDWKKALEAAGPKPA